ncbi:MAG: response regulator [Candidatus Riflebacteria bacterium]|nr:response regulator [Candidatus Riflebacteria bacterium]
MTQEYRPLILIVDDAPASIKVIANMLDGNGYRLALAESGADALKFSEERLPDLILLDIVMPDMDGFEVCRKLKESDNTASIPLIFLNGHADNSSVTRSYDLGGVDYITKPFNAAELKAKVKTHIELAWLKKNPGNGKS